MNQNTIHSDQIKTHGRDGGLSLCGMGSRASIPARMTRVGTQHNSSMLPLNDPMPIFIPWGVGKLGRGSNASVLSLSPANRRALCISTPLFRRCNFRALDHSFHQGIEPLPSHLLKTFSSGAADERNHAAKGRASCSLNRGMRLPR